MASTLSLLKTILNIKDFILEHSDITTVSVPFKKTVYDRKELHLKVRPYRKDQNRCPICKKICPKYDTKRDVASSWRASNLNGIPVFLEYRPARVCCKEHGIKTEYIPWADGSSRFTRDFNNEASWLVTQMSKTAISTLLGINWRTIGNCIKNTLNRLEPCREDRVHCGLKRICVDETSYKKGNSYITVVYDMDRNRVVWVKEKYGESVFKEFCELLTEAERNAIEIVAGDGAKWIDYCTKTYFPNAKRCLDFFHVVAWANETLDEVRGSAVSKARKEYNKQKKEFEAEENAKKETINNIKQDIQEQTEKLKDFPGRGRPSKEKKAILDRISELKKQCSEFEAEFSVKKNGRPRKVKYTLEHMKTLDELKKKATKIRGAKFSLVKNPENRTENQNDMLNYISVNYPELYEAWRYKESLRIILHMKDPELADKKLCEWIRTASDCGIKEMQELSEKIDRHKKNIINSVTYQVNSSKSEATNTTIKALIKTARGFRNLENMIALIYLKCSDLVVPLSNRPQADAEMREEQRNRAMLQKQARDAKRMQFEV